ncbi:hypothetical protein D0T50_09405 [Bacteroides sp. 214]|uniref:OstA-like protein n=1 Tax=Bacteroides sp. 214 TaxID=2302935 RepID=UPI0013D65D4A|nr:OstA-like protein [Bacteroides sp. 214]NDW13108.1 hypothetical protein [Bacteroides sp. 214]
MRDTNKKISLSRHRILWMGILCLFSVCIVWGQTPNDSIPQRKKTRVDLLHADLGYMDKNNRPDVQVLVGNVQFKHDSMYMFCDSAHVYESTNSFEAFDNVRMEQGDTLFTYSDYLFYDGMAQLAMLRNNVKLINRNTTLLADSLNYDRVYDLGYYFNGGMLMDEENVLVSDWGEYSPATKLSVFNHQVELTNPQFVLTSDTLKYNTFTKVATILGPSNIVSDDNHIYSERGIYHTAEDVAELLDRSVLTNQGKKLIGDSLYYNRKESYGEAFDNVWMNDSINKQMLTGDYCYYNELTQNAYSTRRAMAVDYSQGDSLFLHGDTLKMLTFHLDTDSMYREVRAYNKVRFYRTDGQGVCDSLVYNMKDSCISMYNNPILWNENMQLLGEEIKVYMNDSTIDWAHIINQALAVENKDSIHYNQVSGKEIKAYFIDGDVRKVDVIANVLVIFYPEEDDGSITMMNTSETSLLNLYLFNRKMEKMVMSPKPKGTLYPMSQIPQDKLYLPTFVWFDYIRPLNKDDIFNWRGKRAGQELRTTTRKTVTAPSRELINPR